MNLSDFLCRRLGLSGDQLISYARTCPNRYKKYKIKKRQGGDREIAQPAKNLKVIQRILINEVLQKKMPVHPAATAYRIGKSILDNAEPHLQNSFLLKMDFKNFFPSISSSDFAAYIVRNDELNNFDEREIDLLINFLFMQRQEKKVLSIGAPSSPFLSNALMFEFDAKLTLLADKYKISYTRYSDDLSFSTNEPNRLFEWPLVVKETLQSIDSPTIKINQNKTVFSSRKHNRHITGVTISNDGNASLGRQRKRSIRTKIYLLKTKEMTKKEIESLRGLVAFANVIEPSFVKKLKEKYPQQMTILASTKV